MVMYLEKNVQYFLLFVQKLSSPAVFPPDKDKNNKEDCAGSKCARYNRDSEAELFYSSLTDEELDK